MNDTKEIVLYFDDNSSFIPVKVAKELVSRYNELGNPLLIPDDSKNHNIPLVLFNSNPSFQIQITNTSLSFLIDHNYFNQISSMIFDMVDIFDEFNTKFVRMGIVSTIYLPKDTINTIVDKYLQKDNLPNMSNFNFSWFREVENKFDKFNCWERIINDTQDFKNLIIQIDLNTKKEEKVDIEMKYIKEFIKLNDSIIEDRTNI